MTNKSNIDTEYIVNILKSPDIQNNLKILEDLNKELIPVVLELQKQAIPILQTIHSALLAFAEKVAPYIEGFLLAQKAGVFDELKRIHDGLIKQEVDLNAYKNLSLEDVFFALKGQPESRFEEILKERFVTSSPTANTALTSGLNLKTIEYVLNIILLLLTIYNQIQEANQPNLKPKEIAELAAKSAIETHQQIEQEQHQKQINPPRIHATPEHENECYCAHHHGSAIPQSQSRGAKRPIDNGENHISGNNRELLKDDRETQKKEEWV